MPIICGHFVADQFFRISFKLCINFLLGKSYQSRKTAFNFRFNGSCLAADPIILVTV